MQRWRLLTAACVFVLSGSSVAGQDIGPGELITDRPDFTESSTVVGRGVTQVELGTMMEAGGASSPGVRTVTTPLILVRAGINSRLELRFSSDGFVNAHAQGGAVAGTSDIEISGKIILRDGARGGLALAVLPIVSLPTGARGISSDSVDPTVKFTWAAPLPAGFDLSGNVNLARLRDELGRYTEHAVSASMSHALAGGFSGYWEVFGFMATGTARPASWTANSGVTHAVGANMQFDVEVGRGLSAGAPAWFVGAGFAIRAVGTATRR
jgi:hypothetical protein